MPERAGKSALYEKIGPGLSNYNRYDLKISDIANHWLQEKAEHPQEKPWVLFVGLVAPHMPLVVPQQYLDLYLNQDIRLPKLLPRDGYIRHPWVERMASFWDRLLLWADHVLGRSGRSYPENVGIHWIG
jgi:choline-sulfatase